MIKRSDAVTNWIVEDSVRSVSNPVQSYLLPNSSAIEATSAIAAIDFVASGMKLRTTDVGLNASGGKYIFIAFAEVPAKYSLAR